MSNLDNTGLAFLLVCCAGMSTCIGAAIVYQPTLMQLANKQTLGAALGISAGVMIYVSFVEIFNKSIDAFSDYGMSDSKAYSFATLCFFVGFIMMNGLNILVHMLDPDDVGHSDELDFEILDNMGATEAKSASSAQIISQIELTGLDLENAAHSTTSEVDAADLKSIQSLDEKKKIIDAKLHRMGLVTALAIGIHNFPEGLATFVATLADPAVGVALAFAIAIHNIPEGVCVAVPIYFASGSRHKGFFWACVSGMSEILAAGLGWIVLSTVLGDLVYAVLFGSVAGMMVNICVYQLIPTAHKYDPADKFVSHSVLVGMVIMALSLVIFLY